ncbi:hypothetical protein HDU85_006475 [Gaertneriomyces sp. JEL0708]|nr:hypothetical protein HDU85_006475 [Gaertneriomyces sp. JEL0708]
MTEIKGDQDAGEQRGITPAEMVNRRIQIGNDVGTVRYYGFVGSSKFKWFGIEWDDPARGKHSGNHQDTQYFTTQVPNAGSFVKADKVIPQESFPRTFLQALREKYLGEQPADSIVLLGSTGIEVETVGWEKVARKVSKLSNLQEVGLAGMRVGYADPMGQISITCPAIVDLDLSRSLLSNWTSVAEICRELPMLASLRLAHNRLTPLSDDLATSSILDGTFPNLRALTLNNTNMTWSETQLLQKFLPNLEELHLASNNLTCLPSSEVISGFESLKLLNLERNLLSWCEVQKLSHLPVQTLVLSHNDISQLQYTGGWLALKALNISDCHLNDWESVHQLNSIPQLAEIRLNRNPILSTIAQDDVYAILVGRLSKATVINGSAVPPKARKDAELFYLNMCAKDLATTDQLTSLHPRYQELCDIYGVPSLAPAGAVSNLLKDRLLSLTFVYGSQRVEKRLPTTMSLRAVKALAARLCKVRNQVRLVLRRVIDETQVQELEMDDELRDLGFYGLEGGEEVYLESV